MLVYGKLEIEKWVNIEFANHPESEQIQKDVAEFWDLTGCFRSAKMIIREKYKLTK